MTGSYYAVSKVFRDVIEYTDLRINFDIENMTNIIGMIGVLGAFFILMICAFAFYLNEVAGIISINVGIIFVQIIGLVSFGWIFTSAIIGASILILIVLERG
jgi:hypothetical protein